MRFLGSETPSKGSKSNWLVKVVKLVVCDSDWTVIVVPPSQTMRKILFGVAKWEPKHHDDTPQFTTTRNITNQLDRFLLNKHHHVCRHFHHHHGYFQGRGTFAVAACKKLSNFVAA